MCWQEPSSFTSHPPFSERATDRGVAYLSWWSIPVSISHSEHSGEGFYQATQSWEQDGLEMRHIRGGEGGEKVKREGDSSERWGDGKWERGQERDGNSHVEQCIRNNGWWQPRMTRSTYTWEACIISSHQITHIWTHVGHSLSYRKTNHEDRIRLKLRLKAQPDCDTGWVISKPSDKKDSQPESRGRILSKSLASSRTAGEKVDSQLRGDGPINWRLNLSTYLTCCSRIKSVQTETSISSEPTWTYRKHKEEKKTWRASEEEMKKRWARKWEMGPTSSAVKMWLEVLREEINTGMLVLITWFTFTLLLNLTTLEITVMEYLI